MQSTRSWLNELKIRGSYGNVGNQGGIDRYDGSLLYNMASTGKALVADSSSAQSTPTASSSAPTAHGNASTTTT